MQDERRDHTDLLACDEKSVVARNTLERNANTTEGLVFAVMLTSARNNFDSTRRFEVAGRSVEFNDFGAGAVHKLTLGSGMNTFAYDQYIPEEAIAAKGATPVDRNGCPSRSMTIMTKRIWISWVASEMCFSLCTQTLALRCTRSV